MHCASSGPLAPPGSRAGSLLRAIAARLPAGIHLLFLSLSLSLSKGLQI